MTSLTGKLYRFVQVDSSEKSFYLLQIRDKGLQF